MHKQQFSEISELTNGNICTPRSLETFDTADTDTNVCGLDHRNIVSTVADGEEESLEVTLDELDDESLLERRDTAADDSLAHDSQIEEDLLEVLFEGICKRPSVNNQSESIHVHSCVVLLILDRIELLHQTFPRGLHRFLIHDDQGHILADELARHSDIDSSLLSVASQNPDLDARSLESVDSLWDTVLKPVFNGSSTEEEEVLFNEFGGLVEFLASVVDCRSGLVVDPRPLLVLVLGNNTHGQTESPETFGSIVLKVDESLFSEWIVLRKTLEDNGISALGVETNLAIRATQNRRHTLPSRVEFADVEQFIFIFLPANFNGDGTGLTSNKPVSKHSRTFDQGTLIGRRSLVSDLTLLLLSLGDNGVAGCKQSHKFVNYFPIGMRLEVIAELVEIMHSNLDAVLNSGTAIFGYLVTVADGTNRTLAELHHVAGQGSGLVRKDVFDLSEFFDQTGGTTYCRGIGGFVVNVEIRVDEESLIVLDNFDGDKEAKTCKTLTQGSMIGGGLRDGDQIGVQDPISQDIREELASLVAVRKMQVREMLLVDDTLNDVSNGGNQ